MPPTTLTPKGRPHYDVPDLPEREEQATRIAVIVGSDLIVCEDDLRPGLLIAMDGDRNYLADLAQFPVETNTTQRLAILPVAVDTAVRLFPGYLTTESE